MSPTSPATDDTTVLALPAIDVSVAHDTAVALYNHVPNILVFGFVASAGLALYFSGMQSTSLLLLWWLLSLAVYGARLGDLLVWRRAMRIGQLNTPQVAIRRYALGALANGAVWSLFPLLFFWHANTSQRVVIALVLATIAAGSVAVLSVIRWLNIAFIALVIGPLAGLFVLSGSHDDLVIAGLGLALFIALTGFSRVTRENALRSLELARSNERLAAETEAQKRTLVRLQRRLEKTVAEKSAILGREVKIREQYAHELDRLANTDPLTGLLNRNGMSERLATLVELAAEAGHGVKVFFIDLLRFDVIELQGLNLSNAVLRAIGDRLRASLPPSALISRWGGDEFVVAIECPEDVSADPDALTEIAAQVRDHLRQPLEVDGGLIGLDAIIGVTADARPTQRRNALIYQAQAAMHMLRKRGDGGVLAFSSTLDATLRRQHAIIHALRAALLNDAMTLAFQPVVPTSHAMARKMEALLRWHDVQLGFVSPAEFIPAAEENGFIVPLGSWVLHQACLKAIGWPDDVVVCVNVSVHQILAGDLEVDVANALNDSGLPPRRLELELTESVFAQDLDRISATLTSLRELGVKIAIDDFGTGYSSLAYLRHLPVDTIKIDRSFVNDIDAGGRKLLFAITTMARGLGLNIVAEGVETHQQKELLVALGVDYLQGFLLSRPLQEARVTEWLASVPALPPAGET